MRSRSSFGREISRVPGGRSIAYLKMYEATYG
jgi:hypothetical protein